MSNAINWFEIPAKDFSRATKFYGDVLAAELSLHDNNGMQMAFFPTANQGVGGCVTFGNGNEPNESGTLVYLNGGDDLQTQLNRVEPAGGMVTMPKTGIGENGFIAMFTDTEGNRVALHSMA